MKILECRGLVKRYGQTEAVAGLSFSVEKGETLGLLGPNGAGKTTTIKMILGLTRPTGGDVTIDSETRIGYSPETPYFHPFLTGYEVLRFYSRLQRLDMPKAAEQIGRLLDLTGLADAAGKRVSDYSKGMLQRLAFAQALLGDPELLILDEPTSGLDAVGRITVTIADNGAGIPEDLRDTIFDPFVKGDASRSSDGTGLGLAIARKIVERHGGTLELECDKNGDCRTSFVMKFIR